MKKHLLLIVLLLVIGLVSNAQATLIDRGEGLIYSTELDMTFFQDSNSAGRERKAGSEMALPF
jgi:hypothetical protein